MRSKNLFACIGAFLLAATMATGASAAELKVKASSVEGQVQMCKADNSGCKTVTANALVPVGVVIKTKAGSSCVLKWSTGHVVKVGPLSAVKLNKAMLKDGAENTELELQAGKVHARAQKLSSGNSAFNIKTPTAVAGVRGTDFFASLVENGAVDIGVVEGSIVVSGDGFEILVDEGLMFAIDDQGVYSDPIPLPEPIVEEIKAEVKLLMQEQEQEFGDVDDTDLDDYDDTEDTDDTDDYDDVDDYDDDFDDLTDDALDDIDDAFDDQIIEEMVDDAMYDYETGDVEVIIYVQPQG